MPGPPGLKCQERSVFRDDRGVELVGQAQACGVHANVAGGESGTVLSRYSAIVEGSGRSAGKEPAAVSRDRTEMIVQIFDAECPIGRGPEFNTTANDCPYTGVTEAGPDVLSRGTTQGRRNARAVHLRVQVEVGESNAAGGIE